LDISNTGIGSSDSAFKDGASVVVPAAIAAIDSLATTFGSGDNIVIATVQYDNTGASAVTIAAGNLEVRRGTATSDPLISEMQFEFDIAATGTRNDGHFAVLIGRDGGAPANPTYGVFAQGSATGMNAEVKLLILHAPPASSSGDGTSVAIGTTETTLLSHASTVGAGDNVVIAVVQIDSTVGGNQAFSAGNLKLKRSTTVLATNELQLNVKNNANGEDFPFAILIARDVGAPANPTYDVTAVHSGVGLDGEAKLVVISGLSSAIVDTASVAVGTSRTVIGSTSTSFAGGDDIVIGTVQFRNEAVSLMTLAAGALQAGRSGGTPSSNQFGIELDNVIPDGTWHTILRKETTSASNPTYEGAATAPATGTSGELKLVVIHVRDAVEYDVSIQIWNKDTNTVAETIGSCLDTVAYGDEIQCLASGIAQKTLTSNQVVRIRVAHSSASGTVTIDYDDADTTGNSGITIPIPEFQDLGIPALATVIGVPLTRRLVRRLRRMTSAS